MEDINGNWSFAGAMQIWSDIRIKKEIEDINDDTALQMMLAIEPELIDILMVISQRNVFMDL